MSASRSRLSSIVAVLTSAVAAGTSGASAQVFHIKEGDFSKGSYSFESNNAFQQRFPFNADRIRSGHEAGFGYGVTGWWEIKGLLGLNHPDGEHLGVTRGILENVFMLKRVAEHADGISLGWFQAVEVGLRSDETNATIWGPIVGAQLGKFSIATNPFFEKTFGRNREEGVAFVYGWQARYEVVEGVRVGIEGYGRIPDIGSARGVDFQEHRLGGVVLIETEFASAATSKLNKKSHAELELSMLFGMTEATPDLTTKANLHIKF